MGITKMVALATAGVDVSTVPEEIKILPLGHVESTKGDFEVDDESCRRIIEQFEKRKLDLVIDYEHMTLENKEAPAAGWIKSLYKGVDALMAKVEWTEKAKGYLANKEYRYLSPVVLARKSDNKAVVLHSGALTNTPAITGMFKIANSDDMEGYIDNYEEENEIMELSKLIQLLKLPETATEEQVAKKLSELIAKADPAKDTEMVANKTVLALLELPEEAKTEDVTAKILSLKSGDMDTRLALEKIQKELKDKKVAECVELALKAGKIPPTLKEWAMSYAENDLDGFNVFVSKAKATVPMGKMDYARDPESDREDIDLFVLKTLDISKEDYKKYYGGKVHD